MTSCIHYTCDLCFNIIYDGYTLCYMPTKINPATYHLSSIEKNLKEMKKQISAANSKITHICNACAKDICNEVTKERKKEKINL